MFTATQRTVTFILRITDACTSSVFPLPKFETPVKKTYDAKDWNVSTKDLPMDSVSTLAIRDYGRPAPPTKTLFCGDIKQTLKVISWTPTEFGLGFENETTNLV